MRVTWSPRQPIGAQPCPRGQWAGGATLSTAISARGRVIAKAAHSRSGMLRVAEPREARVEAGGRSPWAAPPTQSKRLTSFLIQDILRDRAERRGGHSGSLQYQRQPDPRRDAASELDEAGGRSVAPEDPPSIRPSPTETPTEPESGKRNRSNGHGALERTDLRLMELWMQASGSGGGGTATGRTSRSSPLSHLEHQP